MMPLIAADELAERAGELARCVQDLSFRRLNSCNVRACDADGERHCNLPGGGVEPGETLEDCLVREVMEEGCARVLGSRYIGCQRVDDPDHPDYENSSSSWQGEETADLILYLTSDQAANITGSDFVIDGGLVPTL